MSQWKKQIKMIIAEREQNIMMQRKVEETALFIRACQWHRKKMLTSCILGWKTFAKIQRSTRFMQKSMKATEIVLQHF